MNEDAYNVLYSSFERNKTKFNLCVPPVNAAGRGLLLNHR